MLRSLELHQIAEKKSKVGNKVVAWFHKKHSLDDIMILIAISYPLTIVPQIWKIIQIQDAESISLMSVVLKLVFILPWIAYGVKHKNNPVIVSNCLWLTGYIVIIGQIFVYQ